VWRGTVGERVYADVVTSGFRLRPFGQPPRFALRRAASVLRGLLTLPACSVVRIAPQRHISRLIGGSGAVSRRQSHCDPRVQSRQIQAIRCRGAVAVP